MGKPKAFQAPVEGTTFHGDGREQELQGALEARRAEIGGDPQRVLAAIDAYGRESKYLMNVGDFKGPLVEDIIQKEKPKLILELGTYIGYSAITFARNLPQLHDTSAASLPSAWSSSSGGGVRVGYVSLEKSEAYASVARALVKLAGLDDVVRVLVGPSSATLKSLRETLNMPAPLQFDLVFLDHFKPLYTTDLKILEAEGLVGPGTTLVADNVIKPGNPTYLAYVRALPTQRRAAAAKHTTVRALFPDLAAAGVGAGRSMRTGYETEQPAKDGDEEEEGAVGEGVPGFVYESTLLESWDPYTAERDGIEVSRIVGYEESLSD